jgi:hypothetical protein
MTSKAQMTNKKKVGLQQNKNISASKYTTEKRQPTE